MAFRRPRRRRPALARLRLRPVGTGRTAVGASRPGHAAFAGEGFDTAFTRLTRSAPAAGGSSHATRRATAGSSSARPHARPCRIRATLGRRNLVLVGAATARRKQPAQRQQTYPSLSS